jgi:hypothetical protein
VINPYSACVLPVATGTTPQRGKDQSAVEDFSSWLDQDVTTTPVPGTPDPGDQQGRNFIEEFLADRVPHELVNQLPGPRAPIAEPPSAIVLPPEADVTAIAGMEAALAEPPSTIAVAAAPATAVRPILEDLAERLEAIIHHLEELAAKLPAAAPVLAEAIAAVADRLAKLGDTIRAHQSVGAGGERIDFVALPWRLQANAGLSYRSFDGAVANAIGAPPSRAAAPIIRQRADAAARNTIPMLPDGEHQAEALHRLAVISQLRDARQAERAAGCAEAAANRDAWPLLMWPQRVLRWLGDGEGTTAWVRDYQIDMSKLQTLLDSLRCLAEQQGLPLRRVMLNGHELWRSPSNP